MELIKPRKILAKAILRFVRNALRIGKNAININEIMKKYY